MPLSARCRAWWCFIMAGILAMPAASAFAAINFSGDYAPVPASSWTSSTPAYIGQSGAATGTVDAGSTLLSSSAYLGYSASGNGTVTISGAGSQWTPDAGSTWPPSGPYGGGLYIGNYGSGALNILNGGAVTFSSYVNSSYVGSEPGSTGVVTVDGAGSTWTTSNHFFIGYFGNGTLNITHGGNVSSSSSYSSSYVGYGTGSTGVVTVDGAGSKWTNYYNLSVGGSPFDGSSGSGTLNITNGGAVIVAGTTYVASFSGSTGAINFGANGGTLTTQSLYASPTQFTGTGTINTQGLVSDVDLVFDATHGLTQSFTLNGPGQNITVNLTTGAGNLGAGYLGKGSLTIRDGVAVSSASGYLGYGSGSTGTATVDGAGSKWTVGGLFVGGSSFGGSGTLNITNGGAVTAAGITYVASSNGSVSTINFGANGGTLTTQSLYASPTQLTGTGTVNTQGLVSDVDLVFDATHGPTQSFTLNGPGQNITVNLNSTGTVDLGAGYLGNGSLTIRDGVSVSSASGYLGYCSGSTGTATVDGAGSTWTNNYLNIGNSGAGTLNITHGGNVTSSLISVIGSNVGSRGVVTVDGAGSTWTNNYLNIGSSGGNGTLNITHGGNVTTSSSSVIGADFGSTGVVTVDGVGSTWTNSSLYVGGFFGNTGTLNITHGGRVTVSNISINSPSLLAMDVGYGSTLTVDNSPGSITNDGKVRFLAGAGLTAGNTYTPITAGTWLGVGTYQALGGTWNTTTHVFTVSAAQTGNAGEAVAIDQSTTQRIYITDPTSGHSVGASFLATPTPSNLTFTATPVTAPVAALLQSDLPSGSSLLAGWTFTASGYTAGDPVYLSFNIGSGYTSDLLKLWHYDGSTWSPYTTGGLSYDGTFIDFTVTGFSGYAVTIPEPASLLLLVPGLLLWTRRRLPGFPGRQC